MRVFRLAFYFWCIMNLLGLCPHFRIRQKQRRRLMRTGLKPVTYERIRELRTANLRTQNDLALLLEISPRQYQYYEYGQKSIPVQYIQKLAQFYNVTMEYLLGMTDSPKGIEGCIRTAEQHKEYQKKAMREARNALKKKKNTNK